MMRAYIFDIDGTMADLTHRLHFIRRDKPDWAGFFAAVDGDSLHDHVAGLARSLFNGTNLVIVSGRSDQSRPATEAWLTRHGILYNRLYMRRAGDHRPDYQVKRELLDMLRADGYEPIMAFDDRDQVVKMWREAGIPCAQVAGGNF